LPNVLKALYPGVDWDESKFLAMKDKELWDLRENRRAVMEDIGKQLGIRQVIIIYFYLFLYFNIFLNFYFTCYLYLYSLLYIF